MKYLTFPNPFRLFYTASHSFSGRVLKAKCSVPISGNIINTVVQARMRDRSTTKILSGCRRMTIAYHSWCLPFFTHLTFRLASCRIFDRPQAPKIDRFGLGAQVFEVVAEDTRTIASNPL